MRATQCTTPAPSHGRHGPPAIDGARSGAGAHHPPERRCQDALNGSGLRHCRRSGGKARFRHGKARVRSRPLCANGISAPLPAETISRRSEEHTSELQSLMRISYAVFCLKKKIIQTTSLLLNVTVKSHIA